MKYIEVPIVCSIILLLFVAVEGQNFPRRKLIRTASTTEKPPIDEREAILLRREQELNAREAKFQETEISLTLREESVKLREEHITIREDNVRALDHTITHEPDYNLIRIDEKTRKLVHIGSTESCGENMRFFAIPDSKTEGACDCDYHQCSRPLLYSEEHDQCFWAWSQGPCDPGQWFTFNHTSNDTHPAVCVENKCPPSLALRTSKYYFISPDDGECYETTTKGNCLLDGETLLTALDDPVPKCRTHTLCFPLSSPAQQQCIAGNKRFVEGFCES